MKMNLFLYSSILVISGLTYLLLESSFPVLKILSLAIPLVSLMYLLIRLSIKPVQRLILIFFNEQIKDYDKYVEKPRLLVYIVFLPILVFVIYYIGKISSSEDYYTQLIKFIVCNLASFICILFLQSSWSKYSTDGVNKKSKIESKSKNEENFCDFKLNYTKDELKHIYQKMIDNSFIDSLLENQDLIDDEIFINVLYSGNLPNEPIFKLNFDHVQTKTFLDHLKSRETGQKRNFNLTREKFSKIFKNNNGEISITSLSASKSKAPNEAKKSDIIDLLFDFEKKR